MRSINLQMDGDQIAATWDNFDCLATSPAGFGDTIWQAFGRLIDNTPAIEINAIVTSIENTPQNTMESPNTYKQQLQAEISAFITELEDHYRMCANDVKIPYVIERMRKLSTVQ